MMKTMGSSSSGEIEIDKLMEELQTVEGQIQQLESTPQRLTKPEDNKKLDALKERKAEIESQIRDIQGIM